MVKIACGGYGCVFKLIKNDAIVCAVKICKIEKSKTNTIKNITNQINFN